MIFGIGDRKESMLVGVAGWYQMKVNEAKGNALPIIRNAFESVWLFQGYKVSVAMVAQYTIRLVKITASGLVSPDHKATEA